MLQKTVKYNLIIVDDEKHIREGLANVVDWEVNGFCVTGIFADGRDAIQFLSENPVDVILTDIRMPHVSGLELAKYVWENRLRIKVVILTGFKDFDYAKSACQYGVSYYLLKPTDLTELYETFGVLKNQLDVEKQEIMNVNQLLITLREQFFQDLYLGTFAHDNAVAEQMRRLKFDNKLEKSVFGVIHITINNYKKLNKRGYIKEQIYEATHHFLQMKYPDFSFAATYRKDEKIAYIVYGDKEFPKDVGEAVSAELENVMGVFASVKTEGPFSDIYELAREKRKTLSSGELVNLKQLTEKQGLLFSCLFSNQPEQAQVVFKALFSSLSNVDDEAAHSFIQNLFSLLAKKTADLGIIIDEQFFEIPRITDSEEETEKKCIDNISYIIEMIGKNIHGTENQAIHNAKGFINENYSCDISLEDVANAVFLSPAYLSRIFKKHTGETFSDYLFKVRMNKAKALLKNSNLKIYEIAEKTGIQTPKYFFKLFKDYTGFTPSEYRTYVKGKEDDEI